MSTLLAGCGSFDEAESSEVKIAGSVYVAFETSSIRLCPHTEIIRSEECVDADYCWFTFTDGASKSASKFPLSEDEANALEQAIEWSYWIEGRAQISHDKNGFGHLNQYECKVEMNEVTGYSMLWTRPRSDAAD